MSSGAPDFAYVRYKDNGSCAVVPVTDVKDFAPENARDFDSRVYHQVKWTDAEGEADFYPARIFMLGCKYLHFSLLTLCDMCVPNANVEHNFPCMPAFETPFMSISFFVQIELGKRLTISRPAWECISGLTKDSMFVKELLVMVWSRRELRERSLLGKHCPRFPGCQPKIPLTPWKVAVLRVIMHWHCFVCAVCASFFLTDCFRDRLQAKEMLPDLLTSGLKQFNRFVSEKIADIDKLAKR
ncbi:uncharacterized protein LOC144118722 [Amblyomma americanum]